MNPEPPRIGVLASGRGSNCLALLEASRDGVLPANISVVLSDRAEAPVLSAAASFGVPAHHIAPERGGARLAPHAEQAYVSALRDAGADWVALAGFMRIVGAPLLDAFPGRMLNIHPSLLPAFPGLDGVGQAWRAGVKVAGCTVHFVDAGVDTGPIIAQTAVPVLDTDTEDTLRARVLEAEHQTYLQALTLAVTQRLQVDQRRVQATH